MEPQLYYFFAAAAFLFGLCFGSFLNVCIYRLPLGRSVVAPRSACPCCGKAIAGYDNIPVFSWLILGGRCRNCKTPISPRYLLIELSLGLLWLACFLHFGMTLATVKFFAFTFLVFGLIFTDFDHKLLPDKLTIPGFWLGLVFSILVRAGGPLSKFFSDSQIVQASPEFGLRVLSFGDALIGAAVGAGFLYGVGELYMRLRGMEGMGFGDVKLMAMVGASLMGGLVGVVLILLVFVKRIRRYGSGRASRAWASASLVMRRFEIPFGVFLGSMSLATIFYGPAFLRWYLAFYQ